jgi:putative transcriptional regulator
MPTNRARSTKRMTAREVEADVLATSHELAVALHRVGAMDSLDMRDMDRLCLPPRPDYSGPDVKRIRAATRMSQPVFARLLGVEKSAVAQWERNAKRPSGPALRLLEVLDPAKPDSPIVQVRRGITETAA